MEKEAAIIASTDLHHLLKQMKLVDVGGVDFFSQIAK
jgi:hypothetical protein